MSRLIFDDNLLALPMQVSDLFREARGTAWWALTRRADGRPHTMSSAPFAMAADPLPEQQMFAHDMSAALNRHLHHNGRWLVQFSSPDVVPLAGPLGVEYRRWALLWMDEHGDIEVSIDNEEPFTWALMAGMHYWMEQAEQGWQLWLRHSRVVPGVTPDQLYKRAQGQRPRGAR